MKRLVCTLLFVVLFLLMAEYVLRAAFPYKLRNINYTGEMAYEFDEDYFLRLKKNIQKSFYRTKWNGGTKISWRTNSLGFRGRELEPHPRQRIVVYGDSNIHARFSFLENTYSEQLSHFLQLAGKETEVINAGVIGMGPDQQLLKFQKEITLLEPDIAIFNIFCDNDFGDIIRNRLFELDEMDQLVATSFVRKPDEYIQLCQKEKQQFQSLLVEETISLVNRIFGEKENPNKKEDWIKKLTSFCESEYAVYENKQPKQYTHFLDHYDIDLAVNPDAPSAITKKKLMSAVLDSVNRVGHAKGVKVVIQLLPSVIDLTENHVICYSDLEAAYPIYSKKRLTNTVEQLCNEQGIPCLNLFDTFLQQGAADCYFQQDDHWNDLGQEVAARAMGDYLTTTKDRLTTPTPSSNRKKYTPSAK